MVTIAVPVAETTVLLPKSVSTPEDDWPEFALSDVEISLLKSPRQTERFCSLLEAGETQAVKVVGRLEPLADDQRQYLKRKNLKGSILIELPPVYRFAYGQYDDGEIVFWALGHGGWFRISPADSYKRIYNDMVEALSVFYFITDYFTPPGRRRWNGTTFRPAPKKMEDAFRDFAKGHPGLCPDDDTAEQLFYKHRRFLIERMKLGKEKIDWKLSSMWKHFEEQFPEEFRDKGAEEETTSSPLETPVTTAPSRAKRRRSQIDSADDSDHSLTQTAHGSKRRKSRQSLGLTSARPSLTMPPPPPKKHSRQVIQAMGKIQGTEALWRTLYTVISYGLLPKRKATLHEFASLLSREYDLTVEAATNYCVYHAVDLVSIMQLAENKPVVWTRLPLYKNLAVAKLTDEQKQNASKIHLSFRPTSTLVNHLADFEWGQTTDNDHRTHSHDLPSSVSEHDHAVMGNDAERLGNTPPQPLEANRPLIRSGLRPPAGKGSGKGSGKRFTGNTDDDGDKSENDVSIVDMLDDSNGDQAAALADVDLLLSWQPGPRPSKQSQIAAAVAGATSTGQPEASSQNGGSPPNQRGSRRGPRQTRLQELATEFGLTSRSHPHGSSPVFESSFFPSPQAVAAAGANSPGDVWKCQVLGCRYVVYAASDPASVEEIRAHAAEHMPVSSGEPSEVGQSPASSVRGWGPGKGPSRGKGKGKGSGRSLLAPFIRDGEDGDDEATILEEDFPTDDPIEDDIDGPMSGLVRMVRKESRGRLPVSYLITRIRDLAGGISATAAATSASIPARSENLASDPIVDDLEGSTPGKEELESAQPDSAGLDQDQSMADLEPSTQEIISMVDSVYNGVKQTPPDAITIFDGDVSMASVHVETENLVVEEVGASDSVGLNIQSQNESSVGNVPAVSVGEQSVGGNPVPLDISGTGNGITEDHILLDDDDEDFMMSLTTLAAEMTGEIKPNRTEADEQNPPGGSESNLGDPANSGLANADITQITSLVDDSLMGDISLSLLAPDHPVEQSPTADVVESSKLHKDSNTSLVDAAATMGPELLESTEGREKGQEPDLAPPAGLVAGKESVKVISETVGEHVRVEAVESRSESVPRPDDLPSVLSPKPAEGSLDVVTEISVTEVLEPAENSVILVEPNEDAEGAEARPSEPQPAPSDGLDEETGNGTSRVASHPGDDTASSSQAQEANSAIVHPILAPSPGRPNPEVVPRQSPENGNDSGSGVGDAAAVEDPSTQLHQPSESEMMELVGE